MTEVANVQNIEQNINYYLPVSIGNNIGSDMVCKPYIVRLIQSKSFCSYAEDDLAKIKFFIDNNKQAYLKVRLVDNIYKFYDSTDKNIFDIATSSQNFGKNITRGHLLDATQLDLDSLQPVQDGYVQQLIDNLKSKKPLKPSGTPPVIDLPKSGNKITRHPVISTIAATVATAAIFYPAMHFTNGFNNILKYMQDKGVAPFLKTKLGVEIFFTAIVALVAALIFGIIACKTPVKASQSISLSSAQPTQGCFARLFNRNSSKT